MKEDRAPIANSTLSCHEYDALTQIRQPTFSDRRHWQQEAQAHAEEALAIADRCEYRLKQADIHNFLARLVLDAGNREVARKEAEIAKERAWCDGPPHCYKPALDEAEKILKSVESKVGIFHLSSLIFHPFRGLPWSNLLS